MTRTLVSFLGCRHACRKCSSFHTRRHGWCEGPTPAPTPAPTEGARVTCSRYSMLSMIIPSLWCTPHNVSTNCQSLPHHESFICPGDGYRPGCCEEFVNFAGKQIALATLLHAIAFETGTWLRYHSRSILTAFSLVPWYTYVSLFRIHAFRSTDSIADACSHAG